MKMLHNVIYEKRHTLLWEKCWVKFALSDMKAISPPIFVIT